MESKVARTLKQEALCLKPMGSSLLPRMVLRRNKIER